MDIVKWFDPKNIEHLKAYKVLQETGVWPKGFISEDLEFGPGWQVLLAFKLADLYIKEVLDSDTDTYQRGYEDGLKDALEH